MAFTVDSLKSAFANDVEITIAVGESLVQSKDQLRSQLQQALRGASHVEVKEAIHAIKGAVSLFGASEFYAAVTAWDVKLKNDPSVTKDPGLAAIPGEFEVFVSEIQKILHLIR